MGDGSGSTTLTTLVRPHWGESNGGVFWTKFETISSKIQMSKADSAGRNNLPGGMDSLCLDSFPARRRGLGRNAGGFRTGGFRKFGGYDLDLASRIISFKSKSFLFEDKSCLIIKIVFRKLSRTGFSINALTEKITSFEA